MPRVGLLMGQDIAQALRIVRRGACDIDHRTQHADQTRRGDRVAAVDGKQAVVLIRQQLAAAAQLSRKANVGKHKDGCHHRCAAVPDGGKHLRRLQAMTVIDHLLPSAVHHGVGILPFREHGVWLSRRQREVKLFHRRFPIGLQVDRLLCSF